MRTNSVISERGYAMVALLVMLNVMAVVLTVALPVWRTAAQRERETELVFRGEQYARAIGLFQRKYGNTLPPNVDVLLNERFLRKRYKDPITGEDFQLLGPGSPELARALGAPPPQPGRQGGRGPTPQTQVPTQSPTRTGIGGAAGQTMTGQAPGGIMGVASKSTQQSFRLYNGRDKYNEWVFLAVQASTSAGGPPGAQTPGGPRGRGPGGVRGGAPPGRGRTGLTLPPPGGRRGGARP